MEELHQIADSHSIEAVEERHARDHAPRHHEIAAMNFGGKARRDDRHWQREHPEAGDHDEACHQLAERRHRHDVAIADGRQRRDSPPHRSRNAAEGFRLRSPLELEHHRGRDHDEAEHDDDGPEDRPALVIEDPAKRPERGCRAGELEKADEPEQQRDLRIEREKQREIEWEDRREVDQHRRCQRPGQPRLGRRTPEQRRMFDRNP